MSNEATPVESQAPAAPTPPTEPVQPVAPQPEEPPQMLNPSRAERMKNYKPVSPVRPERPILPPAVPPPLNPNLHVGDVQLCVDVRLETRTEVIYERKATDHNNRSLLFLGENYKNALTSLDTELGKVTAMAMQEFKDYILRKNPAAFGPPAQPEPEFGARDTREPIMTAQVVEEPDAL